MLVQKGKETKILSTSLWLQSMGMESVVTSRTVKKMDGEQVLDEMDRENVYVGIVCISIRQQSKKTTGKTKDCQGNQTMTCVFKNVSWMNGAWMTLQSLTGAVDVDALPDPSVQVS